MIHYIAAGGTDTGLRVGKSNQDSFGAKILRTQHGEIAAAIMCDGMGGYSRGEVASATVVDAFQRWVLRRLPVHCAGALDPVKIFEEWTGLIELCNQRIIRYGEQNGISLGTTASMLLATQEQYMILNVGDCRIYEIRDIVYQITRDQTLVERERAAGLLTDEEAANDPRGHILVECVGIAEEVHPDFYTGIVQPDTAFLMCCDGFRHKIGKPEFLESLSPEKMTGTDAIQQGIRSLIDLNMQRSEMDNISAIVIRSTEQADVADNAAEDVKTVLIDEEHPADVSFMVMQEFCFTSSNELAQ